LLAQGGQPYIALAFSKASLPSVHPPDSIEKLSNLELKTCPVSFCAPRYDVTKVLH
jgi:hypothetical protein